MAESVEQRLCVKFCVANEISCAKTLKMLQKAFPNSCMSKTQAYEWYKSFKKGRTVVQDLPRAGRPSTSTGEDQINRVKQIVMQNRRASVREIARDVGVPKSTAHRILTDILQMKKARMTLLRWGIVSDSKTSNDFCVALRTLPSDEHEIVAVAACDKSRAESFAKLHGIPSAFDDEGKIAEHKGIDVVYIGALNHQHYEIAMLMLEHGKHVLCETPLCMNHSQTSALIKYAEKKNIFLMEGVWCRFLPAYQYLRMQIDAGHLGDIESINVSFGLELNDIDSLQKNAMGGGVILDLGIYTIQCSQWAFQEPPLRIVAKSELNSEGVDIEVNAELHYTGGRVSKMSFSAQKILENKAVIKGTKAQMTLLNFWCPTKLVDIDGHEKEWALPKRKITTNFPNSEGLRYEAEAVRQSILDNKLQNNNVSHNDSLLIAQIRDEIRKQLGVSYGEDIIILHNCVKEKKRSRPKHFNEFNDTESYQFFHMSKTSAYAVLQPIASHIKHPTNWNNAVSEDNMLLMTLRLYATGGMLRTIGDLYRVFASTVSTIIKTVSQHIACQRP